jgi:Na+/H+ antiporter NhaD/arsenite permease-like protein
MIEKRAACAGKAAASALLLTVALWSSGAMAATGAMPDGALLGPAWALPFAGILLSIALFPLIAPRFWHHHFGKIAAGWAIVLLVPFGYAYGFGAAAYTLGHALVAEYIPFIVLLTALYTIAGGICVRGALHGSPRVNTVLLALGTALASIMGTTGAAMLLIRPLLRANSNRRHVVHVFVFFIFLVANAGGSLSPLGDPPLFLGFLNGVSFFWTTRHLALPMLFICTVLLALFYALDAYYYRRPGEARTPDLDPAPEAASIVIEGKRNFVLLGLVIGLVLSSGLWKPGIVFDVAGLHLALQDVVRDVALIVLTLVSLAITPQTARTGNAFTWAPIEEVAKIFGAIFVTIAPVVMMLRAGEQGAFAGVLHLVTDANGRPIDAMYFWATGILSSFLDNAPTYLVFFNLVGGDARVLMEAGASTLAAISAGAVFMGANSYIGNAPNFMVKAIAESRGVRMPSFFGYIGWSATVLIPVFLLTTWLFF